MFRRYFFLCTLIILAGCATFLPEKSHPERYPIGIYSVSDSATLAELASIGFSHSTGPAQKDFLDGAQKAGVKILASPDTSAGINFNARAARQAVQQFDKHPALWAWYLIDEPDLNEVSPADVRNANNFVKRAGAQKPTALVLFDGKTSLDYARLADITMIDRYPISWLPLANFSQHVQMTRLALGRERPLIAVIQAFSWEAYREMLPDVTSHREPTPEELRCMTYSALAEGATGVFFYCYDSGKWKITEHPKVWSALKNLVGEMRRRDPLFTAKPIWWTYDHQFKPAAAGWNAALQSSIHPTLLTVKDGNNQILAGQYVLAVNTAPTNFIYRLRLPENVDRPVVPVFEERRSVDLKQHWMEDSFEPFAVHIYGPL